MLPAPRQKPLLAMRPRMSRVRTRRVDKRAEHVQRVLAACQGPSTSYGQLRGVLYTCAEHGLSARMPTTCSADAGRGTQWLSNCARSSGRPRTTRYVVGARASRDCGHRCNVACGAADYRSLNKVALWIFPASPVMALIKEKETDVLPLQQSVKSLRADWANEFEPRPRTAQAPQPTKSQPAWSISSPSQTRASPIMQFLMGRGLWSLDRVLCG